VIKAPVLVELAVATAMLPDFKDIEAVYIVMTLVLKTLLPMKLETSSGVLPRATSARNSALSFHRNSTVFSFDGVVFSV